MMPHYITTHNSNGEAIFSDKTTSETVARNFPGSESTQVLLSSLHSFPADLSTEQDIEHYKRDREHGFADGAICPPAGTSAFLVNLAPGGDSPMHRTMTLDTVFIIEGVIEMHLDSGEKRTLTAGDTIVQRGTMHRWVNVTPDGGWARMMGMAMAAVAPIKIAGKELGMEFRV